MNTRALEAAALDSALREAIEKQQFTLYYQPQVDIRSGRVVGAEALLRWRRPDRGIVAPGEFLARAEENGLIVPINEWVLREACREAKTWQRPGAPPLRVSVNLSPIQFRKQNVPLLVIAHPGRDRPRPVAARSGADREHRPGERRSGRPRPAEAARSRRQDFDRRFRHRLLVADLRQAVPGRSPQDRPMLHPQPHQRSERRGDHSYDRQPWAQPRARGRRRRSGVARADAASAFRGLPRDAGLLFRQADAGRGVSSHSPRASRGSPARPRGACRCMAPTAARRSRARPPVTASGPGTLC